MAYKKIKIANLLSEFATSENTSDNVAQNANLRAFKVLMNALGVSMSEAQRLIDKGRLFCNGEVVSAKNEILRGEIELISYENASRGQKPIFDNQNFAVFDKQSGILSHPNGRNCAYSLCDEIWHLYGAQAGVAHRLDRETSGLILVAKDKKTQTIFKTLFEKRLVKKEYLALVSGQTPLEFSVDLPMNSACDEVKTRMRLCPLSESGKEARTEFKRLCYFSEQDLLNLSREMKNVADKNLNLTETLENFASFESGFERKFDESDDLSCLACENAFESKFKRKFSENANSDLPFDKEFNKNANDKNQQAETLERKSVFARKFDENANGDLPCLNSFYSKFDESKKRQKEFSARKNSACDESKIQLGKGFDFSKGVSLLVARPLTGRQHQIRLHLFASGFAILGEPLYGLEKADIERILDKQMSVAERVSLTGATRLCLHSNRLAFEFGGKSYDILSQRDIRAEFLRALSL